MAHKKGAGSSKNKKKHPIGRRLGVKKHEKNHVSAGEIIIRQRGTKFHAGDNVILGRDHTCNAKVAGYVSFQKTKKRCFVSVIPS